MLLSRPAAAEQDVDAPRWDLPALMALRASAGSGTASFVERRFLQVMTAPLLASGTLRYVAPDRLEKRTLQPEPALLAIEGDVLTVQRPGAAARRLLLSETPEIAALVEGLRATMAGDRATLERFYTVSLSGNATSWRLSLQPRDARTRRLLAEVRIDGQFASLARVETREADGDRTEMTIAPDPP